MQAGGHAGPSVAAGLFYGMAGHQCIEIASQEMPDQFGNPRASR